MTRFLFLSSTLAAPIRKLALVVLILWAVVASAQVAQTPEVHQPVRFGVSLHLRDLVPLPNFVPQLKVKPVGKIPPQFTGDLARHMAAAQAATAVQMQQGNAAIFSNGLIFEGMGRGVLTNPGGFSTIGGDPPDTNGAVGKTQFAQNVNTSLASFDKATGLISANGGPHPTNLIWQGLGGPCETDNDGDGIVLYDKFADRWLISQMAVNSGGVVGPFYQCVAISRTSDFTGQYYRYVYQFTNLNDYPKFSVWPDAYYLALNMFDPTGINFVGGKACALDRTALLNGSANASMICFPGGNSGNPATSSMLPSDWDGTNPPPNGSPNFFLQDKNNFTGLELYKFHVDFATPANSTFTGPISVSGAGAFVPACFNGGNFDDCVPQPGPGVLLDALGDRGMFRLAYRYFADGHESLVVNHSVTSNAVSAIQWYEIRDPNGNPTVFQSGTYQPDTTWRWMGSIAQDQEGNMLLGYSVSDGNAVKPGIRYTGRLATDPPGSMTQTEATIVDGTGVQTGDGRWGDYTSMSVDPVDDCTFWYTNEYMTVNGQFRWQTKVASVKKPTCGSDSADLTLTTKHGVGVDANNHLIVTNFQDGQVGDDIIIQVRNVGGQAYAGTVAVTDAVPAGLTVTSISGTGWTCTNNTFLGFPCTRNDGLAAASEFPKIDIKLNVDANAPVGRLTNTASLCAGAACAGETNALNNTATDVIVMLLASPPAISKAFGAASIALNTNASLTFTITNPGVNTGSLTGVTFTDTLPAGLVVATPNGQGGTCNGTLTAVAGSGSVSLSGQTLAANGSCTLIVDVTGTTVGVKANTTGAISSNESGAGATSNTANITVVGPPAISKAFGAATIGLNATTTLTFTITNPGGLQETGLAFTDSFPAGMEVASSPGASNTCGGTFTPSAGDASVTLAGGSLAGNGSCTISVNVKGTSEGVLANSVTASATNGVAGNTSTANLTVANITMNDTVPPPASISPGGSFTTDLTINAGVDVSATVTCTTNAPQSSCQVLTGMPIHTTGQTVQVRVTTTAGHASNRPLWPSGVFVALLGMPAIVIMAPWTRRRDRRKWLRWIPWLGVLLLGAMLGCGGGNSTNSGPTVSSAVAGTPAGNWVLMIHAQAGNAAKDLQVPFVVQ